MWLDAKAKNFSSLATNVLETSPPSFLIKFQIPYLRQTYKEIIYQFSLHQYLSLRRKA